MTSNTTPQEVRADHVDTANVTLNRLLSGATPETLTAALCCLRLPWLDNALGDKLRDALEERVRPFRKGQWPDWMDEVSEIAPALHWLTLLDRYEDREEGACTIIDTGSEHVNETECLFVQGARSDMELFFTQPIVAQRLYVLLRNELEVSIRQDDGIAVDSMTPCLHVTTPTANNACRLMAQRFDVTSAQTARALQELEEADLVNLSESGCIHPDFGASHEAA